MYKLIYSCGNETVVKSKDLSKLLKIAEFLYLHRDGAHYKLILKKDNKMIKNWSCACYRRLATKLPSFDY